VKTRARWIIGGAIVATLVAACGWLVLTDAPAYQFLVRLYVDKRFLKHTLREWGVLAPVIFIGLQALQVIIAPIPGELTGILGGYLFGQWVGLLYSTIGLTVGSVAAFAVGRWLGTRYVQKLVSPDIWRKMGFIVEAEGVILCFIIFLIPGLPKDMTCYLFGLSPMPFWVFAVVSTLGRVPGTWQPLLSKAGLPYRKYHATRHTYATWLLSDGADLRWVQQQMGHATIGQTADIYGHVQPERHEVAVVGLDRYLTT
jgi:uncharacterized membrane protein YdjX (TVP38/TMEM64 family)